jgi:phosphoribosylanthranilate isomerase
MMKKIVIQIYEVQDPAEAQALIALGVDHVGSVIVSENDWKISAVQDTIRDVKGAGAKSSLIPLFNHPDSVFRTLEYYQPDMVHFCEALVDQVGAAQNYIQLIRLQQQVKQRFPDILIMRSIPIVQQGSSGCVDTLEISREFEAVSDFFLTDTLLVKKGGTQLDRQPVEGFVGITGQTCDWEIAAKLVAESPIPVILAGGISPQNVSDAIQSVQPAGVDSCTQTNMQAGNGRTIRFRKDLEKVKAFVQAVKAAEKSISIQTN